MYKTPNVALSGNKKSKYGRTEKLSHLETARSAVVAHCGLVHDWLARSTSATGAPLNTPFFPTTMTSRINIARPAATSSYSPDPHGLSNSRPMGSGYRAANPDSDDPIAKLRTFASQVEDYIEIYSQPLKPHLPAIGRFLIVVTFLEDAWRIMTQWSDQLWYLERFVYFGFGKSVLMLNVYNRHRKFPWGLSHVFLLINVVVSSVTCSIGLFGFYFLACGSMLRLVWHF